MINELRTKYPKIYNVWRCIKFTKKGKKIGHSKEWNDFITFLTMSKTVIVKERYFEELISLNLILKIILSGQTNQS